MTDSSTRAFADLHLHTSHSDGLDAPAAVVARALKKGCAALAITDHDTLAGNEEAASAARESGLQYLNGVEISTVFEGTEVHVIGLGVGLQHEPLNTCLAWLRDARHDRVRLILERLNAAGVDLTAEDVAEHTGKGAAPGRLNVARALLVKGVVRTAQEAFDRFLNPGLPAFVPRELAPATEAIDLIQESGGLAFVAHPGLSRASHVLLPKLLELPFDGFEAYHISHRPGRIKEYLALAKARRVLVSGGSDCHGGAKGTIEMGKVRMPLACFDQLCKRIEDRSGDA